MPRELCVTINHRRLGRYFFYCRASGGPMRIVAAEKYGEIQQGPNVDTFSSPCMLESLELEARIWLDGQWRRVKTSIANDERR